MPDNEDYKALARLLEDPEAWSPKDADLMRGLLRDQRAAVTAWHPKDLRRRAEMTAVADDIETAISRYERSR